MVNPNPRINHLTQTTQAREKQREEKAEKSTMHFVVSWEESIHLHRQAGGLRVQRGLLCSCGCDLNLLHWSYHTQRQHKSGTDGIRTRSDAHVTGNGSPEQFNTQLDQVINGWMGTQTYGSWRHFCGLWCGCLKNQAWCIPKIIRMTKYLAHMVIGEQCLMSLF